MSADGSSAAPAAPRSPARLSMVLAASAAGGCALGLLHPTWQVAIEPAQVLAGFVRYAPDNPYGLYQAKVWTLWHQILAPLLAAGVPEKALAHALSGAVGALSFAAIASFASACGAAPAWAVAAPFLVWLLDPIDWGFNYPVMLLGSPHTYGIAGLAFALLACGVLGSGRFAAGAFLLGVAPAFHPSIGAGVALSAGLAGLAALPALRPRIAALAFGGFAGAAVAAASLLLHLRAQPAGLAVDSAEAARHLGAFLALWDAHRAPVDLAHERTLLLLLGVGVALALAGRARAELPLAAALGLRVYTLSAALGIAFVLVRDATSLPTALAVAMPARLANLAILALVPLLIGALTRRGCSPLARWPLALLVASALLWKLWLPLRAGGVGIAAAATLLLVLRPAAAAGALSSRTARNARPLDAALAAAVAAGVAWTFAAGVRGRPQYLAALRDRSDNPVFAAASRAPGLLAIAPGIEWAQLRTRHAIVTDPNALDMLPYAPEGGPALARILAGVYGIDFFAPAPQYRATAVVPVAPVRRTWQERSTAEWAAVAADFGVSHVLAPARWTLSLPVEEGGPALRLYRIPSPNGDGPADSQ